MYPYVGAGSAGSAAAAAGWRPLPRRCLLLQRSGPSSPRPPQRRRAGAERPPPPSEFEIRDKELREKSELYKEISDYNRNSVGGFPFSFYRDRFLPDARGMHN